MKYNASKIVKNASFAEGGTITSKQIIEAEIGERILLTKDDPYIDMILQRRLKEIELKNK